MKETKKSEPRHPGDAMAVISESITRFMRDPGAFIIQSTTEDGFVTAFRGLQQKFPDQQLTVIPWRHQFYYREALGDEILVPTSFMVIGNLSTENQIPIINDGTAAVDKPRTELGKKPTPEQVLIEIATYFDITVQDIASSERIKSGPSSKASKIAVYIFREHLGLMY